MKRLMVCSLVASALSLTLGTARAQFQDGDILIGKSIFDDTLAIVRGGSVVADPFTEPFIQALDFDNTDGVNNNLAGNLVMINRGSGDGSVYIGATDGSGTATLVGDFNGGFPAFDAIANASPTAVDVFGQVAVSPDNSKVVITTDGASDNSGSVLLFDYDPSQVGVDNTMVLTNGRALTSAFFAFGLHEVEWIDNDTLILADGDSAQIDTIELDGSGNFDTASRTKRRQLLGPNGGNQPLDSDSAPVAFNPEISPLVYVGAGDFAGGIASNYIWILDPNQTETNGDWKQIARARYDDAFNADGSNDTIRDLELIDEDTLAVAMFGGSIFTLDLTTLDGAACGDPADFDLPDGGCGGLADNTGATQLLNGNIEFDTTDPPDGDSDSSFVAMTIARAAAGVNVDLDNSGNITGDDLRLIQQVDPSLTNDWESQYGGTAASAAAASVPEPATALLAALALASAGAVRRRTGTQDA